MTGIESGKSIGKVLIVSEHASMRFGGEASLPWHYFARLRGQGVETWLVVHERTRDELTALAPDAVDHMHFIEDTTLQKIIWKLGRHLPARMSDVTLGFVSRIATQLVARRITRRLVKEHGIDIVHQPMPVSPREPSFIANVGAPVVIGPMNGNMSFPDGIRQKTRQGVEAMILSAARRLSDGLHLVIRGKRDAALLLVANERTRRGLPPTAGRNVVMLVENGVDTRLWHPRHDDRVEHGPVRFVFMGRLVDWKAVDILIRAVAAVGGAADMTLDIIGDGPMRQPLEELAEALCLGDTVRFCGFQPQPECARALARSDVLVLPSLYECGGAVVLEAMASALPVIATDWGGPADYLDPSCGILVEPSSFDGMVEGFAAAIRRLAADPALRRQMGQAGRDKALRDFDWDDKIGRILALYSTLTAVEYDDTGPLALAI